MSHITAEYAKHEHNPSSVRKPGVFPLETTIVGNSYRNSQQQSALRNKNPGNRVLVVPEPGNVHDRAALAVLVAKGISSNQFVWTHVGYIPREVAAELSKVWPRYRDVSWSAKVVWLVLRRRKQIRGSCWNRTFGTTGINKNGLRGASAPRILRQCFEMIRQFQPP